MTAQGWSEYSPVKSQSSILRAIVWNLVLNIGTNRLLGMEGLPTRVVPEAL